MMPYESSYVLSPCNPAITAEFVTGIIRSTAFPLHPLMMEEGSKIISTHVKEIKCG